MQALQHRLAVGAVTVPAIVTLNEQVIQPVDTPGLDGRGWQADSGRELHAERFVVDDTLEARHGRLQNMGTRRIAQRQTDVISLYAYRDFVLRTGEGQAYTLITCQ